MMKKTQNLLDGKLTGSFPGLAAVMLSFIMALAAAAAGGTVLAGCEFPVSMDPDSGSVDTGESGDDEFAAMLRNLGVDTSQTPAKDPKGNPLPAGYNPLRAAGLNTPDSTAAGSGAALRRSAYGRNTGGRTSLHPLYEIWLGGVDYDGKGTGSALYEDFEQGWPVTLAWLPDKVLHADKGPPLSANTSFWLSAPKKAVGADFDGDGYDEVLIAAANYLSGQIVLRLGRKPDTEFDGFTEEVKRFAYPGGRDALAKALPANSAFPDSGANRPSEGRFYGMDLAAGDIDADGMDEAILIVGGKVFLLDYTGSRFTVTPLESFDVSDKATFYSVAFADYNQDGYDDWVLAGASATDTSKTAGFRIYDGKTRAALRLPGSSGNVNVAGSSKVLRSVNIVTGDFDGDGLPETAFCGRAYGSDKYLLFILDTAMDEDSKPVFAFLDTVTEIESGGHLTPNKGSLIPALVAGDINGDDRDEIFAVHTVYAMGSLGGVEPLWTQKNEDRADPGNNTLFDLAVCGDVNGDQKADVLYYDWAGRLIAVYADDLSQYQYKTLTEAAVSAPFPALALANVDEDSYVMEYLGHDLRFTDPVVEAVLASPPFYGDITYPGPIDHLKTAYGEYESGGGSSETRQAHGVEAKASIGVMFETGFFKASTKITFSGAATWGFTKSKTVTSYMSRNCGLGEDLVVYTCIPYDVYYYKVISAPPGNYDGENGEEIMRDSILHFDLPRKPDSYSMDLEGYNACNGDNPDVTVPHTVGKPSSYLTSAQMKQIKESNGNKGLYTTKTSVRAGIGNGGCTSQSTEIFTGEEKNFEWYLSVMVSGDAKIPIGPVSLTIGGGVGYNYSYSVKQVITESLYIEGEVPNIPPAFVGSTHPMFRWGLLMYPYEDKVSGQAFNYVTYWVDVDR